MKPSFIVFGFGYVAQFLTPKLADSGFDIVGTRRKIQGTSENPAYHIIHFQDGDIEKYLSEATHILLSIPPAEGDGDIVLSQYGGLIKKYRSNIEWMGYLSSTGVYGNYDGVWVNELSHCHPLGRNGVLRLRAETDWMSLAKAYDLPLHIFRLAGIYGPRRNAIERIIAGRKETIYKPGQFFSRIHVDDIAAVIIASVQSPNPLSVYNLADDEPASSDVLDAYATYLLNKPPLKLVPFEEANLSPMEREFYSNNRRVSNAKIKEEFGFTFQYPSFRDGLNKIFEDLQHEY